MLFHATDPVTGVEFALKLIQPPFGTEPEDLASFVEDARTSATLEHPHVARVFGAGVEEGLAWVAMELLTGGSLAGRLAAVRKLGEADTLTFGIQAASALAAANAAGLTHHDLATNNFVFDEAATLKITDFGQAIFYERLSSEVGIIWGRPAFVAPERLARSPEDAITDIYGLGTTLFCALTGTPPYDGEAHGQILFDRMSHEQIRVENHVRPIHAATAAVLNRMLSASRARRFQSWEEVIEHLTRAHAELTGRATPPAPATHPVHAPTPRISPAAIGLAPTLPPSATAPAPDASRFASLLTLAMLAAILGILGALGWKHWFAPKPRVAAVTTPLARAATPHVPATVAETPQPRPPAPPPATPARPKAMDWSEWKTAMLESPARKGIVTGSAHVIPGSAALRLSGNHTGIEGTTDECAFHHCELTGDWTLLARVTARAGIGGLVAREGQESGRPILAIWIAADGKVVTARRPEANAKAEVSKPAVAAKTPWLKLMRRGDVLTAHYSGDGKKWRELRKLDGVALPPKIPVGFVVWSGKKEATASATFGNVALTFEN